MKIILITCALVLALACGKKADQEKNHLIKKGPIKQIFAKDNLIESEIVPNWNISDEKINELLRANNINQIENFYLSFNKSRLNKKYIMGGFFSNSSYPIFDLVPLQSKIVTFKHKGDKLYMIDVTGNKGFVSTTEPVDLIDAFPVKEETETDIIVDFTSGDNKFSFSAFSDISIALASPEEVLKKQVSMLDNFKSEEGYIIFDNILSLASEKPIWLPDDKYPFGGNPLTLNIKLTYFIKEYEENKNFKPSEPWESVGYFLTKAQFINHYDSNGTLNEQLKQYILKWDINKKHKWYYSPDWPEKYVPALKHAISEWNKAFKRDVFSLEKAPEDMSPDAPNKNYILWAKTKKLAIATAYATETHVPTTGEIISAKIVVFGDSYLDFITRYFNSGSFTVPEGNFSAPNNKHFDIHHLHHQIESGIHDAIHASVPKLSLGKWSTSHLCLKNEPEYHINLSEISFRSSSPISFDEFALRMFKSTVVHEMGHTVGLRHNFKGSLIAEKPGDFTLQNQQTSVMEYLPPTHSYLGVDIGAYDYSAVNYGYHNIKDNNVPAYCTDENVGQDPYCLRWDAGDSYEYISNQIDKIIENPFFLMQAGLSDIAYFFNPLITFITASSDKKDNALKQLHKFLRVTPDNLEGLSQMALYQIPNIKFFIVAMTFAEEGLKKTLTQTEKEEFFNIYQNLSIDKSNYEPLFIKLAIAEGFKLLQDMQGFKHLRDISKGLDKKIQSYSEENAYFLQDIALYNKIEHHLDPYF